MALEKQAVLRATLERHCQAAGGWLPFSIFMDLVLYAPESGYYTTTVPMGKQGDYFTAPELSPLFSYCLGMQCAEILKRLPTPATILELGAGTGRMASDLLHFLESQNQLPESYLIFEVSSTLKRYQQSYLKQHCPAFFDRIQWLDRLPSTPMAGILLANEVLDALPFHLFQIAEKEVLEGYVGQQNEKWVLAFRPSVTPHLSIAVRERLSTLPFPLPVGYTSEIALALPQWLSTLSACFTQGVLLFIDYGFPRQEYYHPSRKQGTLMCHHRHRTHSDPLQQLGQQDITAHVDFTALAEASLSCDLTLLGFTTQAAFLLANDLLSLAQTASSPQKTVALSKQIQILTQPHEMGELFKVMALGKQYDFPLKGFSLYDYRHRL